MKVVSKSMESLLKHFNDHGHIKTESHAALFKTGIIDVDLLLAAGLYVHPSLLECQVVGVRFAAMTRNHAKKRVEPVFSVMDGGASSLGTTSRVPLSRLLCEV